MEFTRSTQGLTRPAGVGVFSGMMYQNNHQLELALKFPQVGEHGGDLNGVVFIGAMQSDERIQDQKGVTQGLYRIVQFLTVCQDVQAQGRSSNDLLRQGGKRHFGSRANESSTGKSRASPRRQTGN